jgi:hypothetical protein
MAVRLRGLSVKDLAGRTKLAVALVALTALLGCSGLNSSRLASQPASGVVAVKGTLDFGIVPVGKTAVRSNTIVNNTGLPIVLTGAQVNQSDFRITNPTLPVKLSPGEQTALQLAYSPRGRGSSVGTVVLASNVRKLSPTFILKGEATTNGQMSLTPTLITFGTVLLGKTQTQAVNLSNPTSSTITLTNVAVTGQGFILTGLSLPLTLKAGQNTIFTVTFAPVGSGTSSGSISLTGTSVVTYARGNKKGGRNTGTDVAVNTVTTSSSLPISGTGAVVSAGNTTTPGQLAVSPTSLNLGSVKVGTSQTQSATIGNTGGSSVNISQVAATGTGFTVGGLGAPATLGPGQSASFSVTFSPQSAGPASGNLSIVSDASNGTLAVPLTASGAALGVLSTSDPSLSFGSVAVGNSTTQSETLTNSGGSSVTITQANATGSGFHVTGLSLPMTLSPGQSFTFGAAFAPTSGGSASGSISVISDASDPTVTISLTGSASVSGQLAANPSALNFGNVVVGQTKSLTGSLAASGSSITVTDAGMTSSEFTLSGLSLPLTLSAGQSVSFTVNFKPQASGTAAATASFNSNASNAAVAQSLTGNAMAPPQHNVSLAWNPSTSSVVGYNVYRGTTTGGPYSQVDAMNASTSYVDNSVQAGQTYFYVTTAVDSSGKESPYSNQTQADVPNP